MNHPVQLFYLFFFFHFETVVNSPCMLSSIRVIKVIIIYFIFHNLVSCFLREVWCSAYLCIARLLAPKPGPWSDVVFIIVPNSAAKSQGLLSTHCLGLQLISGVLDFSKHNSLDGKFGLLRLKPLWQKLQWISSLLQGTMPFIHLSNSRVKGQRVLKVVKIVKPSEAKLSYWAM